MGQIKFELGPGSESPSMVSPLMNHSMTPVTTNGNGMPLGSPDLPAGVPQGYTNTPGAKKRKLSPEVPSHVKSEPGMLLTISLSL